MPIKPLTVAVLFTVVVTVSAHAAQSQQSQGGQPIVGSVIDPTGAVLPAAQLELRAATGTRVGLTTTDGTGTFRFERVPPGRFDLTASFEGFRPTTVRVIVGSDRKSVV